MNMTPIQKDTLASAIRANPMFWTQPDQQNVGDDGIADYFNSVGEPPQYVWKEVVTLDEIKRAVVYSEIDTLSAGQDRSLAFYLTGGYFNATDVLVRAGLEAIFGETSQSLANLMASPICKRPATHLEALFSSSAGDARVSALYGARLSPADVADALFGAR